MSLSSDLIARLHPDAISEGTKKLSETLLNTMQNVPRWYNIGAEKYREMACNGETPFTKPTYIDHAKTINIPSREEGRGIPCRLIEPKSNKLLHGVFIHIHGGGWCLSAEDMQDPLLEMLANDTGAVVVSVGYRLAPEHPFPAGFDDCVDVAFYLAQRADLDFHASLMFIGGDSAGAHLSVLTAFQLQETNPNLKLKGLILSYGMYDLSQSPSIRNHVSRPFPVLDHEHVVNFLEAFLPNRSLEDRQHPSISPYFADLSNFHLPDAIFLCGTNDILLEDSILMATRWQIAGGQAVLKLYPGAVHGFLRFPPTQSHITADALEDIEDFMEVRGNPSKD